MGKHKHRRRDQGSNNQQMPVPMAGFGGLGDMLGGGSGGGMNGIAGLLSSLGGLGGGGGNGMGSLLSGLMGGGGQSQGGDPLAALGGIGGIMSALQGLGSVQPQQQKTPQPQTQTQAQPQGLNLKEMLSNISESDMDALREVFNELLNNENKKVEQKLEATGRKVQKNEQSIDQILSNLDFNSILNSINNMDLSNIDFENFDLNNFNIDDISFNTEDNDDDLKLKMLRIMILLKKTFSLIRIKLSEVSCMI
jgi:hypothetical protein